MRHKKWIVRGGLEQKRWCRVVAHAVVSLKLQEGSVCDCLTESQREGKTHMFNLCVQRHVLL